jgi:hypothetical protein
MKIINSRTHGVIDYVFDVVFLLAPSVFGFSAVASTLCYVVAGIHFLTSICTQYELSLVKLIPFPVHGGIEFAAAIILALMPWLAEFATEDAARNFFVASGVALFGVWLTTNYRSTRTTGVLEKNDTLPFQKAG